VLEIVSDVVTGIFGRGHFFWKAAEAIENTDYFGTRLEWLLKRGLTDAPVVKAWSATSAGRHHSDKSASRIALRSRAPNWPAGCAYRCPSRLSVR
jgi:hypothetical protein